MTLFGRQSALSRYVEAARSDAPDAAEIARVFASIAPPAIQALHATAGTAATGTAAVGTVAAGVAKFGAAGFIVGAIVSSAVAFTMVQAPMSEPSRSAPASQGVAAESASGSRREASERGGPTLPSPAEAIPAIPPLAEESGERRVRAARERAAPDDGASQAVGASSFPAPPSSTRVDVDAESFLIESARHALHGTPERALAFTREHAMRFPSGLLALEREVIAIRALVALGLRAEARARLDVFSGRYPESAHLAGLRGLVGTVDASKFP